MRIIIFLLFICVIIVSIKLRKFYPLIIYGGLNKRTNSERKAIEILAKLTNKTIKDYPTVRPKWLKDPVTNTCLELDGYNKYLKIAIEFSGPLHYKWYPRIESYNKYFQRIRRDILKIRLCKQHGICLIVLEAKLGEHNWRSYIESRLYDCNMYNRPHKYIPLIKLNPYRDPIMERTLNLSIDNQK